MNLFKTGKSHKDKTEKAIYKLKQKYPEKFQTAEDIFTNIHPGDRIFISTACAEPQYLIQQLIEYVDSHPKAFVDAQVLHVWSLGIAPYTDKKFKKNFRLNSFFISNITRESVNAGNMDYAPIFLHKLPSMFTRGLVPVNVALIHTSLPNEYGLVSLGVSVDICKAAIDAASLVIAQVNPYMPVTNGNSFIHIDEIDYILPHSEPILEFNAEAPDNIAEKIGQHVSKIVEDGDTIQVGYGSIPNALVKHLKDKKHLGIHTELFGDGLAELMKARAVDNSRKNIDQYKTVCAFCMGKQETYDYIDENPAITLMPVDYTNNPLNIAKIDRMTAINSALQVDLTGQSTAESLGTQFFSGIGGQADFVRGASMAPNGKVIMTLPSTANNNKKSRIVPMLDYGSGVTLTRGDIHYVVTEYGIAYLQGKNIRERAMALIAIAHPKFRPELIEKAKELNLIFKDQAFIPGERGEYPEHLEARRTTRSGRNILLRPVKISDEPLLKDFFYSLSDKSVYRRFCSVRRDMPHERLQAFVVIDYTKEMVILAVEEGKEKETVIGVGQYTLDEDLHSAEVALVVRDEDHNHGIGSKILRYMTFLAKRQGLLGFTAEVLTENDPILHLLNNMGFDITRRASQGLYYLTLNFRDDTKT